MTRNLDFFRDPTTGKLHGPTVGQARPGTPWQAAQAEYAARAAALPDHATSLGNGGYRTTAARGAE